MLSLPKTRAQLLITVFILPKVEELFYLFPAAFLIKWAELVELSEPKLCPDLRGQGSEI